MAHPAALSQAEVDTLERMLKRALTEIADSRTRGLPSIDAGVINNVGFVLISAPNAHDTVVAMAAIARAAVTKVMGRPPDHREINGVDVHADHDDRRN